MSEFILQIGMFLREVCALAVAAVFAERASSLIKCRKFVCD